MPNIITESDLVIPTLKALEEAGGTGLTTAELQPILRLALKPSGEDLALLDGRGDDKFSQKVRNLRSHKRLERDGLASFARGRYIITPAGQYYLNSYGGVDKSLRSQGFSENSKKMALSATRPLKFVEEGQEYSVTQAVRRRSRLLRVYAIAHYSEDDGTIICAGCNFEASKIYGADYVGLIEIHHLRPIALAGSTVRPLREAVKDVVPLCPTCHRVVHAASGEPLSISALRSLVKAQIN